MDSGLNYMDKENGMNGWQRVWVLACVGLGIAVFVMTMDAWPTTARDEESHRLSVRSNELQLQIMQTATDYPDYSPGVINENNTLDKAILAIAQEDEDYRLKPSTLFSRQLALGLTSTCLWLLACGMLYAIGLVCRWVGRGFSPKTM